MCVSCGLPEAEAGESFKQENPVCGDLPDFGYPGPAEPGDTGSGILGK